MRSLHFALPLGVALAFLGAPSLAHSQAAPFDFHAGLSHVESLSDAGRGIDAFSESVKLLRGCLETYGPSTIETTMAIHAVTDALIGLQDLELTSAMWEFTRIAALENMAPCDQITVEAIFESSRYRRSQQPHIRGWRLLLAA